MSIIIDSPVIIIVSNTDFAGLNMKRRLLTQHQFTQSDFQVPHNWPNGKYEVHSNNYAKILTIANEQIFADYLKEHLKANLVIFASKHSSSAGKKALLVHTTGIWGKEAGHGGNDHELSLAPSYALTESYHRIKQKTENYNLDDYWVGVEVSHHGPSSLKIPVLFMETGGTEVEWRDQNAANVIADVMWEIVELYQHKNETDFFGDKPAFIGIGGGHYCPSFIKKLDSDQFMLGHVAPKYSHEFIDETLLKQAFNKTLAKEKIFLIDKKGTKSVYRKKFIEIIEKNRWSWDYTSK